MNEATRTSRRDFLRLGVISGVSIWLAPLYSKSFAALFEEKILTPVIWNAADGRRATGSTARRR